MKIPLIDVSGMFIYLVPVITFLLTLFIGIVLRNILFGRLSRWAQKTKTELDDIIIVATKGPFLIWCVMLGVYLALEMSQIPGIWVHVIGKVIFVLGAFSVMLVLANISSRLIKTYSGKIETALPVTSLTQNISRIIIFGIGILVILNSLGISITPILATLGVGGLAVALALQDTLSNLFSGFHVIMAKQIKVGDYIKLDSGEEGYVTDITWRTTKIKMLSNNVILVPNEKLTKAIITNFHLPNKETAVLINLGVHYKSDLNKVEKVTSEVAKEVMKTVPGGIPEFEPFVRYGGFGDSAINLTVILRAKEFVDQYLIKHEFVKKVHERFDKEGIIIPYPIRTLQYERE